MLPPVRQAGDPGQGAPRTAPRDVFIGDRQVLLDWRKTRWHCGAPGCGQGTFTEWLPAVKPRARLTSRLRTRLGEAVGDDLMPAAAAARRYGDSDRTATRAFTACADEQLAGLDEQQGPVQAAGVDEFRRGAPADRADPETGEVTRTRSEWLTHLVDLDGGGTLGLAEGRTAAAEEDLLTGHAATLRYLAMDLSATYRSGAPAGVTLVADAFHLVKLANRKIDDAFRRLGYRTEHAHEELGLPRRCTTCCGTTSRTWTPVTWPPSSACWTPTPTASRSPRSGSPRSTCATAPDLLEADDAQHCCRPGRLMPGGAPASGPLRAARNPGGPRRPKQAHAAVTGAPRDTPGPPARQAAAPTPPG